MVTEMGNVFAPSISLLIGVRFLIVSLDFSGLMWVISAFWPDMFELVSQINKPAV